MMTNDTPGSARRLLACIPWWVELGVGVLAIVYGIGVLTDTLTPLPNDVMALIWGAVAIGLFLRAVRLNRKS